MKKTLIVLVALALCASAQARAADEPELQRALDELVAAGAPGALAFVRDGDRTVRVTSGHGNLSQRTPLRAGDRFRIGSVTKTFVATVVLQLVGEGRLSLDDTVERRLPGLVPNGRAITVRQLLNMTSGLFDYLKGGDPTVWKPYREGHVGYTWKPRQLVEIAVSHPPQFAPGARWSYCNTCYVLLGLIVEQQTGHSLAAELRRRIFVPLRLRETTFDSGPRIAGRHAHGYTREGKRLVDVSVLSPSFGWAAGAIVSTADDVASFYRALLGGRLLPRPLMRAMQTTVDAGGNRYGLGIAEVTLPCGAAWGHQGGTPGYSTWVLSSRDGRRQVVVLATRDDPRTDNAIERVLATAYCGQAGGERKLQRALDELVAAGAPGAVLLVRDGDRTIRLTSGYADLRSKRPMNAGDRFRVGSATKSFVATVVLQLVDEGKLRLGDSVERWLPGLVPNGRGITVRQLLNHTSGLFDYAEDDRVLARDLNRIPTRVWAPRELVAIATSHPPLFAPGARWAYSNTNYFLLGLIVESATGHELEVELRTRIFAPLGLRGTSFDLKPRIAGRYAHGYEPVGGRGLRDVSGLSPSLLWAAGAVVSTADDLARFFRALFGGRLLPPELLRAMRTTVPVTPEQQYGLGVFRNRTPCGALFWGHGGGLPGYTTEALMRQDGRRQFVLLVNRGDELWSARAGEARFRTMMLASCRT